MKKHSIREVGKNLYLVDGESDINIGYSMQANIVEPYQKKNSGKM